MKDFLLFAVFLSVIGFIAPAALMAFLGVFFSFIEWSTVPLAESFEIINSEDMLFASRVSALLFGFSSLVALS